MVRKMGLGDTEEVIVIHRECFPGFFLSFLGPSFLRVYYEGACIHPNSLCFIISDHSGKTVGFVAGVIDPSGFYSFLLKTRLVKFALAAIGGIVRDPLIIPRLVRALFYPGRNPKGDHIAGLFSLGILPKEQGKDYGKRLVIQFMSEAKKRGCQEIVLTTDKDNNHYTNMFYQKIGFKLCRSVLTPEKRAMNEYSIKL